MRRLCICAPLLALLLCLTGMMWATPGNQGPSGIKQLLSSAIGRGYPAAAAESPAYPAVEQIELDGAVYQLENGIAYVVNYVGGASEVRIPLQVMGQPVSFERFWVSLPQPPRVILAEGYTQATERQFGGITASELILPSTLREIGDYAFSSLRGLKTLILPEGVERIGDSAFAFSDLEEVILPRSLRSVAQNLFYGCNRLRSIAVHPDNPRYTAIDGALYSKDGKTLLCFPEGLGKSYTMPDGTEAIDAQAFGYNETLQSLTIGEGIRTLPESVLSSCVALRTIRLSSTVQTIEDGALPLSQLDALEVPQENPYFVSIDGTVYGTADGTLLFHPRGVDTAYSVLPGTKRIGWNAFAGDSVLVSVSLPLGLESIGSRAFINCTALESVSMPLTLTEIGDYAFVNCIALQRLALPPCLLSIGTSAFFNCSSLPSLNLPSSLQVVGDSAFEDTPQMTITAQTGTVGEAHVRIGRPIADPLGIPYADEAAIASSGPISVGIVNNQGTDDLLALYETAGGDVVRGWYPNGTTMIIRADEGEWLLVIVGHADGYVKADGLMRNEAFYTLYQPLIAEVPVGSVDLMSAPLAETHLIERVEGGAQLHVTAACGTWYQVLWNGEMAYVPTNLVAVTQYEDLGGGGQYGVVENPNARDRLHLRDKPSRDGNSLQRFFNGTQVEILSAQGDWYHVRVAGIEGYMMASYVKLVVNAL